MLRDSLQELRELGLSRTLFRLKWELLTKTALQGRFAPPAPRLEDLPAGAGLWTRVVPFASPQAVVERTGDRVSSADRQALQQIADEACRGRVRCFSRWTADFGDPINWHRDPQTGAAWDRGAYWSRALRGGTSDIKTLWEVGRFPQAFHLARAAAWCPEQAPRYSDAFSRQLQWFLAENPVGLGVHWASGQEIAFRLLSWIFGLAAFERLGLANACDLQAVAGALLEGARHVEANISYAERAVYNNHLLSEALLLYVVGVAFPGSPETKRWRARGESLLLEQAEVQFYRDGGYLQNSHTYQRIAIHDLLVACLVRRGLGAELPGPWLGALERSLEFLSAHQCEVTGRLPNFGPNDGGLPLPLSCSDYADFRPTLQALSLLCRGERCYPPGPHDEFAAWTLGPEALDAPLRPRQLKSASFRTSGYHVLRSGAPGTFASFRCGSVLDRFGQMDMLSLDLWWRGQNVVADPGTYRYNAAPRWHRHFTSTAAHSTLTVAGLDQMLHYRQFKCLYPTPAQLLRFESGARWAICSGEHSGFARVLPGCVHRRTVAWIEPDLWVVVDRVQRVEGQSVRLHWQLGAFPWRQPAPHLVTLETPAGEFSLAVFSEAGVGASLEVAQGQESPPRGWISRYYGEKEPAPSVSLARGARGTLTLVSLLAPAPPVVSPCAGGLRVEWGANKGIGLLFADGDLERLEFES